MRFLAPLLLLLAAPTHGRWEKINVPTTASLRGLSPVNENVVWASGTEGTVIRTVDGGKNWAVFNVQGGEKMDFRGITAFDDKTAVIMSSGPAEKGQARIYRTGDGGATWMQMYEDKRVGVFFDAIAFWDRQHGIVLSDPIEGKFVLFTTEDGGVTWRQLPPSVLAPALPGEGAFAASNSCLAVEGRSNVWFATGGARVARVFRSRDRGRTWAVSDTPMRPANGSSGIFSLAFQDANNGIAVGGDYAHPDSSELPNVLVTADGGKSWKAGAPTNPAGMYLSDVNVARKGKVIAVGIKGLLVNSGDAWVEENEESLNGVAMRDGAGWAVGARGTVLRRSRP